MLRNEAILLRHHGADLLEHRSCKRMLERKSAALALRFFAEVAMNCTIEERSAFGYARNLVVVKTLRERDALVLRLYYGLRDDREHTLEQIGQKLGITRERVRQLRDRALKELREGGKGEALASFAA